MTTTIMDVLQALGVREARIERLTDEGMIDHRHENLQTHFH
ncbi:hypothetical protein D3OALGA1CA_2429 [Olavius algarvensis associated proteobacterium Delta 3]|nr:hypothetical protein D3OALGA1CA_2429 [Olavius algarvensis associated proteobacterium Delta 3]CAB5155572.1 hypothetical protein D3OALGB2SA_5083 [Olavius algarvensis associated proteobacterium Delta 3]